MRRFFSHTIPMTPWRAASQWQLSLSRLSLLTVGLIIFGIGDGFLIITHLGNAPWSVLAQGLSLKLGISIGWATFSVSTAVLLLWIPFRQRPGAGTIANILVIALAIDLTVAWIPAPEKLLLRILMMIVGVALVGAGSAIYLTCGLGPGPRDGLMTALHYATGFSVARVRAGIEGVVLALGWVLGGRVGPGTLVFALGIGGSVALWLTVVGHLTRNTPQ
ncbi:MAG: hypothetical protein EBT44_00650 [Actinobacteria bacterium]|uniref:YitT family protein n=1 Tax=Candidatus Fonsibacter lacus TaxID=2576439 RepID=A0A965GC28_9PROT|nr:hypothetical protein [Candidatus Fonsibacter lacus]